MPIIASYQGADHEVEIYIFIFLYKTQYTKEKLALYSSSCFMQLFLHNMSIVGEGMKMCVSTKNLSCE